MSGPPARRSPVPQEVGAELQRVVERWRQLPLEHALSYAGRVRALIQTLADGVARASGVPASTVPDCGPATLMDQLSVMVYDVMVYDVMVYDVMVYDASAATSSTPVTSTTLARDLANLRRQLS